MIKLKNKVQEFLSLIPKDKLLHYFYGSILAFIFALMFEIFVVILLVLLISMIKELLDDKFSITDIIYTILPAIFLALISQIMIKEFNEWMASIGNIYYANNELMEKAFDKIEQHEKV